MTEGPQTTATKLAGMTFSREDSLLRRWYQTALLGIILALSIALASTGPVQAAQEPPARHVVQPGDALTSIAQSYGSTVPAIMAANLLRDPDVIAVGQVLVVPVAHQPLLRIEVLPGDTLASIARQYRTTSGDLATLNEMASSDRLVVGQDLLVPPHPDAPSPAVPSGPIASVVVWPIPARQGETVAVQVELMASDPVSLSLQLQGQSVPLRPQRDGILWGLVAIHALTEPGVASLDLCWRAGDEQSSAQSCVAWPLQIVDSGAPTFNIELPPGKGDLLDPELIRAEAEILAAIWGRPEEDPAWAGRFLRPVQEGFVTSAPFGQKRSYNGGPVSGFHTGQDFAAPEGTPVTAPAAGRVVLAEPLIVRGNAVVVDHGAGLYTGYWHLSEIDVSEGQEVQPGDLLGLVGTTGLSTGAHLHWEMRLHGIAVSPLQWVNAVFPRP